MNTSAQESIDQRVQGGNHDHPGTTSRRAALSAAPKRVLLTTHGKASEANNAVGGLSQPPLCKSHPAPTHVGSIGGTGGEAAKDQAPTSVHGREGREAVPPPGPPTAGPAGAGHTCADTSHLTAYTHTPQANLAGHCPQTTSTGTQEKDAVNYHGWPDHLQTVGYPTLKEAPDIQLEVSENEGDPPGVDQTADQRDHPPDIDHDGNQNAQFNCYHNWPFPIMDMNERTALIYDLVRSQGVPNYKGAKIPLNSTLDVETWEKEATGHEDDDTIIQGIQYGFPLQYTGGPVYTQQVEHNHPSAEAYTAHVDQYFRKECEMGAIEGPFTSTPFTPWCRVSPLMTRPKSEEGKRRIIVDLSYPDGGVNASIHPHLFNGDIAQHNLPTIADLTNLINAANDKNLRLAVIDISRAYRHFQVCPLDWPLLVLKHRKEYYFDRSLPFGARMSAFVMGTVAQFVIRALDAKGITGLMYLDDLVIIAPAQEAQDHYRQALQLFSSLGLAVAEQKLQPPAELVTWLGIRIDLQENELSIPQQKLAEIQKSLADASRRKTLTRKQLQRVIGQINHLAKVVQPARLFMGRLLEALRGAPPEKIQVSRSMTADFSWFRRFLKTYNGRSIIPMDQQSREIWADACLEGGGATDGRRCYSYAFPTKVKSNHHITHLEAINCLAAARTFTTQDDVGKVIIINCDNLPAVNAFRGGKAKDPVLNACARAFWYLAAGNQATYQFNHIPGCLMNVPDALSRVMLSREFQEKADRFVQEMSLKHVPVSHKAFAFSSFYF